jgi:hypothetical protein
VRRQRQSRADELMQGDAYELATTRERSRDGETLRMCVYPPSSSRLRNRETMFGLV